MNHPIVHLPGERFGSDVIVARLGCPEGSRIYRYLLRCDCGYERVVTMPSFKKRAQRYAKWGRCYHDRVTKEKHDHPNEFKVWQGILRRCLSPTEPSYPRYGGRGITVCERWMKFANFVADMGPRPSLKHSVDRIDNNGNYEPSNCHWATYTQQNNNRRDNTIVLFRGQRMTVTAATAVAGNVVKRTVVAARLYHGWSAERALTTPQLRYRRKK